MPLFSHPDIGTISHLCVHMLHILQTSNKYILGPNSESSAGLPAASEESSRESPKKELADDDIVETLLAHEKKEKEGTEEGKTGKESSSESEFEDVDEGEEETEATVTVKGVKYDLSQVSANPVLVEEMTAEEKSEYIRISQQHFDD